ncbi:MAG: pyridoxamine 5'-phosphate oxidase family protein [Betaproteobacteria bacterium]|nr:pyridoxamine 5'-phosphate oxidase family protein [Betaproteobacteria bacterium]
MNRADALRPVDDAARAQAAALLSAARHGALAALEPGSGHPLASRVALVAEPGGALIILISALAAHAGALQADPRCSVLIGEPAAGDPLAHPRLSLVGQAWRLDRDSAEGLAARERYLRAHPKAALYADFGDFAFWRIAPLRASLNAGFGRAHELGPADLAPVRAADDPTRP